MAPTKESRYQGTPYLFDTLKTSSLSKYLFFIAIAGIIAAFWTIFIPRENNLHDLSLEQAYQAIQQNEWTIAEALFKQMTAGAKIPVKSSGYAGLAALAYQQGDLATAQVFADKAEALDQEIVYSHVIRGNILFQQGKLLDAYGQYRAAVDKKHGLPWQKAIAYDRLGRIQAARGNTRQAMEHYDNAIRQNREMAAAYANKGFLQEKVGEIRPAMELYRQALELDPDDVYIRTLLQNAERKEALARNREKQAQTDKLVAELVQLHRQGKSRSVDRDAWTSTPLTLAFLNFQEKGAIATREGEAEFILTKLVNALQMTGRVTVVERIVLDKLLAELKLSVSELTNPRTATQIGRILAARLIATGTYTRFGQEGQLSIRVTETETTRTRVSVAEIVQQHPQQMSTVLERTSRKLLYKLRAAYPLQGRVVQVAHPDVFINIGAEQGLKPGIKMHVFGSEEPIELAGKALDALHDPAGLIEVTAVDTTRSRARILEKTVEFEAGWKVREMQPF